MRGYQAKPWSAIGKSYPQYAQKKHWPDLELQNFVSTKDADLKIKSRWPNVKVLLATTGILPGATTTGSYHHRELLHGVTGSYHYREFYYRELLSMSGTRHAEIFGASIDSPIHSPYSIIIPSFKL